MKGRGGRQAAGESGPASRSRTAERMDGEPQPLLALCSSGVASRIVPGTAKPVPGTRTPPADSEWLAASAGMSTAVVGAVRGGRVTGHVVGGIGLGAEGEQVGDVGVKSRSLVHTGNVRRLYFRAQDMQIVLAPQKGDGLRPPRVLAVFAASESVGGRADYYAGVVLVDDHQVSGLAAGPGRARLDRQPSDRLAVSVPGPDPVGDANC